MTEASRLEEFEVDCFDKQDAAFEVPVRAFLRRSGLGHVYDELLRPTMEEGSTLVALAQRQRPWPPWGVGARTVSAMAIATPVAERTAGLGGVIAADEEATEVGLLAAVYQALLDGLSERGVERVHYVVREGGRFGERLMGAAGFERSSNLILTEEARYWLHDAEIPSHRRALGIEGRDGDELITGDGLDAEAFERTALFLLGVSRALDPWWRESVRAAEVIANTGPGQVAEGLPPGGPPKPGQEGTAPA